MVGVYIACAFVLGLAARALGMPPLVGFLAAGFALDAAGLAAPGGLEAIAHAGVLLMLFTVGMKVRLRNIVRAEVWGTALLHLAVSTTLLGILIVYGLGTGWVAALLAACALGGSVAKFGRSGELSASAGVRGWRMNDFKGRHFGGEIVLWAVRWYCRYAVSYRDLEAMMTERGVAVDHCTIYRWVQRFAPEMEKRLRWQWRRPQSTSWRIDETYVKVRGQWAYLYRALDKLGNTIDFYLSATRNTKAAKRFLGKALRGLKEWEQPEVLNTDKAPTYAAAIAQLKAEGKCPTQTRHRQVKYLNNVIEADHGKLKQLIRPVRGFKTMKTAYATIKGFEVMRALRKGQAEMFALQGGIVGEARIVERAFGVGPCVLTEAMAWLQDRLASAQP